MGLDYIWIDRPATLEKLVAHLAPGWVALDTEADSLHHYKEDICLVQITQRGQHFLLDPFAELDLAPMWAKLESETWVLHGADFDLRMMRRIGGNPAPSRVFDTMLAAQILNRPALGYAALVESYFAVTLCKKNQKGDWSRRPLNASMLEYAVQDTLYLEPLAEKLNEELIAAGRKEWHEQSCARVARLSRIDRVPDPDDEWRLQGSNKQSPGAQAVLRRLWHWREKEGERADRPVFKVISSEFLLDLAAWADSHRRLPPYAYPHWPRRIINESGPRLAEAVEKGRHDPPVPPLPKPKRPPHNPAFEQRMEQIRQIRDKAAAEHQLDPSVLASKSILTQLAQNDGAARQLVATDRWNPWQAKLMGLDVEGVIPGSTQGETIAEGEGIPAEAPTGNYH